MPYKDAATRREFNRRRMQIWRETHRSLSTAEIEERLRMLGLAIYTADHPQVISLDEPAGRSAVDRQTYADWAALPFDGDEAGLDDPEDGECGAA